MIIGVTGGAGYIGSHTCVELLDNGFEVVVMDNLSNSSRIALERVESITGKSITFHQTDLTDRAALEYVFNHSAMDAVIHFAGLKAVGESVEKPMEYYHNNLTGTLNLIQTMAAHQVRRLVFSSSATVYGTPASLPITEDFPLSVTNPYGRSKLMIEEMLRDLHTAASEWDIALLRYFNPVGAHSSGRIGEDPRDIPNNLVPYIAQVAVGRRPFLRVFGDDYPTRDGTGVRDYIHVCDLAQGHIRALEKLMTRPGVVTYNLGTGRGTSVLELVRGFEAASGREIPFKIMPRRAGDISECYADPGRAQKELEWKAERDIADMCRDTWRWQKNNPRGYAAIES